MPSDCPVKADRRSTFHPAHASKDRSTATPNAIQLQAVNAATTTQLNLGRLRTINAFNRSKLTPPFIRAPNQVPSRQLNTFGSLSASTRNPRRPTDAIDHADAYYRLRGIESKALRALNEEVFHEYSGLTLLNDFTDRLHFHCRELVFDLKKDAVGCDIREIPIEEFTESILQISLDSSTVRNVMEAVSINEKHVKEAWSIRSSQSIAQKQPKQQESPLEESTHKTLLASPGSSAAVNEMADLSIKSPQANPGNAHEQPKLQGNLLEERSENAQFTSPAPSAALKETDASSIEPPQDKADYAQEQTEQQEKQRKKQQKKNQKKKQKKQQECPIMQFVSLGMLIIDDIHHSGPHPPMLNILGGAGTYATLGARLFCIPEHFMRSPNLGYVVHAGTDFGKDVRSEVESWKTGSRVIETPERLTTRGENVYKNGLRDFKFLTPKIQVNPDDLSDRMLRSRTYHLMCTPARCIELVKGILEKRKALHGADTTKWLGAFKKPIFLWEPMEGSCRPGELKSFCEALKYVDIFSPNSHELASLFNDPRDVKPGSLDGEQFLYACRTILTLGFGIRPSAIIVRMGADGCFVHTMNRYFNISPWHSKKTFKQSFDVTGGGNAFMGGFAAGLIARDELLKKGFTEFEIAAIYGSVASSFAIEQVGMPKLTHRPDGTELWNGQSVQERLATMRKRILKELGVPRPMSEAKMRKQSLFHPDGASHKGEL